MPPARDPRGELSLDAARDERRATSDAQAEILFVGYRAEGENRVAGLAEEVLAAEHLDRLVRVRRLFG